MNYGDIIICLILAGAALPALYAIRKQKKRGGCPCGGNCGCCGRCHHH